MDITVLFIYVLLGVFLGTVTGLVPGLHTNNIALVFYFLYIVFGFDGFYFSVSLFSMAITHSFVSFIPSVYMNAPEEGTFLSLSISQKYAQKGLGHKAVFLSVVGGFVASVLLFVFVPLFFLFYDSVYYFVRDYVFYFLSVFLIYAVFYGEKRLKKMIVVFLSGLLGLLVLNVPYNKNFLLLPLFSGLFGVSGLLAYRGGSFKNGLESVSVSTKDVFDGGVNGIFASLLSTLIPSLGITSSTLLSKKIFRLKSNDSLMVSLGGSTTLDAFLSVIMIYLVNNARSGVGEIISNMIFLNKDVVLLFLLVFVFVSSVSGFVTLRISRKGGMWFNKDFLRYCVLGFVVFMTLFTSGYLGLLVLIASTCLGLYVIRNGFDKTLMNFVLIVPTILFYL